MRMGIVYKRNLIKTFLPLPGASYLTTVVSIPPVDNANQQYGGDEVALEDLLLLGARVGTTAFDPLAFRATLETFAKSQEEEMPVRGLEKYANREKVLERINQLAASFSLYAKVYGPGTAPVVLVSRKPLPEYRADYDPKLRKTFAFQLSEASRRIAEQTLRELPPLPPPVPQAAAVPNESGPDSADEDDEEGPPVTWDKVPDPSLQVAGAEQQALDSREGETQAEALESQRVTRLSTALMRQQHAARNTPAVQAALAKRKELPAYHAREQLAAYLATSQVLLISGETGCGKSTQVPQMILEDAIDGGMGGNTNVLVTQPRRISAISLARRVAAERGESLGDVVGYKVRREQRVSGRTRLTFCTTGVLLRRLIGDPELKDVTHILVDEIHERKMNEDFLIIILASLLPRRPDLKLILMSATINAEAFQAYFGGCPRLHIPGFTHPVTQHFLEDVFEMTGYRMPTEEESRRIESTGAQAAAAAGSASARQRRLEAAARSGGLLAERDWHLGFMLNAAEYTKYNANTQASLRTWMSYKQDQVHLLLVAAVVEHIVTQQPDGAVLVFLTGWDEIVKLKEMLGARLLLRGVLLLPVHSSLPTDTQQEIFNIPPAGVRKVVLATNIAETSITIPDVVYVVDAGKAKERSYDVVNKIATLLPRWVSKASVHQRRGRAGRVRPGVSYHLFPRAMMERHFAEHEVPELLRTPLMELCLQIRFLGLGEPRAFLARAMNPPDPAAVQHALDMLQLIGALDASGSLTPLGSALALLPVDPCVAKMIVVGAACGLLDPVLSIAAAMSTRDPFVRPMENKDVARQTKIKLGGEERSDHIAALRAYESWRLARRYGDAVALRFCHDNHISFPAMELINDVRLQFAELLRDAGLLNALLAVTPGNAAQNALAARAGDTELEQLISSASASAGDMELLKCCMVAGMYPNLGQVSPLSSKKGPSWRFQTLEDGAVRPHPSSVNDDRLSRRDSRSIWFDQQWLVYSEKVKTSALYLRYSTCIGDLPLLLFAGDVRPQPPQQRVTGSALTLANGLITFSTTAQEVQLIMQIRAHFERHMDCILAARSDPSTFTAAPTAVAGPSSSIYPAPQLPGSSTILPGYPPMLYTGGTGFGVLPLNNWALYTPAPFPMQPGFGLSALGGGLGRAQWPLLAGSGAAILNSNVTAGVSSSHLQAGTVQRSERGERKAGTASEPSRPQKAEEDGARMPRADSRDRWDSKTKRDHDDKERDHSQDKRDRSLGRDHGGKKRDRSREQSHKKRERSTERGHGDKRRDHSSERDHKKRDQASSKGDDGKHQRNRSLDRSDLETSRKHDDQKRHAKSEKGGSPKKRRKGSRSRSRDRARSSSSEKRYRRRGRSRERRDSRGGKSEKSEKHAKHRDSRSRDGAKSSSSEERCRRSDRSRERRDSRGGKSEKSEKHAKRGDSRSRSKSRGDRKKEGKSEKSDKSKEKGEGRKEGLDRGEKGKEKDSRNVGLSRQRSRSCSSSSSDSSSRSNSEVRKGKQSRSSDRDASIPDKEKPKTSPGRRPRKLGTWGPEMQAVLGVDPKPGGRQAKWDVPAQGAQIHPMGAMPTSASGYPQTGGTSGVSASGVQSSAWSAPQSQGYGTVRGNPQLGIWGQRVVQLIRQLLALEKHRVAHPRPTALAAHLAMLSNATAGAAGVKVGEASDEDV